MLERDPDQLFQVVVQQADRLFRVAAFHQAGETFQVGKDEAAFLPPAAQFQLLRMVDQVGYQVG